MDKITNFKGIKKYFCSECNGFHKKRSKNQVKKMRNAFTLKYPNKEIKISLSKFDKHKEFGIKLSDTELWQYKFKKSAKKYNIKQHKKSAGSRKQ